MGGICGIFNLNGEPVSPVILRKMTDAIAHRGLDGEGFYVDSFTGKIRVADDFDEPLGHEFWWGEHDEVCTCGTHVFSWRLE